MQSFERQPLSRGNWLEYCKKNDELRKSGLLNHLRAFQISDQVYGAVISKNLRCLDNLKDFRGDFDDENYCDIMRTVSSVEEAHNAISMRRFDVFNHRFTIRYQRDGADYIEVLIEGLSSVQLSLTQEDIVILRDHGLMTTILEGDIRSVNGDIVRITFRRDENLFIKRYSIKSLNISFIPRGFIHSHYDDAITMIRDNISLRNILLERDAPGETLDVRKSKISLQLGLDVADDRLATLNDSQRHAVNAILAAKCRPKPYILVGPPGTGKTQILVEAAAQIYARNDFAKVLICAKSEGSADQIVCKLKPLVPGVERFYSSEHHESLSKIHSQQIIVTINSKAASLKHVRRFDYVFIDDACNSSELETLPAICLVKEDGCLVLAGDPMQQGPTAQCEQIAGIGLCRSLMERLLEFRQYKKDPKTNKYNGKYIKKLVLSYRCRSEIMKISNMLFYEDKIRFLPDMLNHSKPLLFFNVKGEESNPYISNSWINDKEAEFCADLLMRFCQEGKQPSQVGLVTPCKSQAQLIAEKLAVRINERYDSWGDSSNQAMDWNDVQVPDQTKTSDYTSCKVDDVEAFQGCERDFIVISTVRSWSPCCLNSEVEAKRFNVALSRARKQIIVVGNENAMQNCEYWREFLNLADRE